MLIAMAGLPATGKSAIAARLAQELGGVVLNKDQVRTVLFPPPVLDYSAGQDDICMAAIYNAAVAILKTFPEQAVIIDGRTFLRSNQVEALCVQARSVPAEPCIIECVCADHIARERLEKDLAQEQHPAGNRTYALFVALKAKAEPILLPHLVVDTGTLTLEQCVERCVEYVKTGAKRG